MSGEPEAQRARMKSILAHGVKEDLVERVRDWPGVHAGRPLLDGGEITGTWFDQTREYAARRRGEDFERLRFATEERVVLTPLPCWQHLGAMEQKRRIAELVQEIEEEAAARRAQTGKSVLGRAEVLRQNPHERPAQIKRTCAPLVHAASQRVRKELRAAYHAFVAAFREAAERLPGRARDLTTTFPIGSFPPALPFVGG